MESLRVVGSGNHDHAELSIAREWGKKPKNHKKAGPAIHGSHWMTVTDGGTRVPLSLMGGNKM